MNSPCGFEWHGLLPAAPQNIHPSMHSTSKHPSINAHTTLKASSHWLKHYIRMLRRPRADTSNLQPAPARHCKTTAQVPETVGMGMVCHRLVWGACKRAQLAAPGSALQGMHNHYCACMLFKKLVPVVVCKPERNTAVGSLYHRCKPCHQDVHQGCCQQPSPRLLSAAVITTSIGQPLMWEQLSNALAMLHTGQGNSIPPQLPCHPCTSTSTPTSTHTPSLSTSRYNIQICTCIM